MALILTIPPTAEPITLSEAKAHLRLTHSDDDTYVSNLIIAARRAVESRCDLAIMPQSWQLYADRWPSDSIFKLRLHPVASVDGIAMFGEDDVAQTLNLSDFYFDLASRPARVVLRSNRSYAQPTRRANGIRIAFTCGYTIVPLELKQAMLMAIADWYGARGDEQGGALPAGATQLLSQFKPVRI